MKTDRSDSPRHPIRVVSKRTGLTPAVLRAWEKRYGVVVPFRTDGGQRLYSDEDVLRLSLLHRVVDEGRSISQVANLPTDELQGLVREDEAERQTLGVPERLAGDTAARVLERAQTAIDLMDPLQLERTLTRAAMTFSVPTVIDDIVVPLLTRVGTAWETGRVGPAHEHLGTVTIRRFLEWAIGNVEVGEGAPVLVAATPAGERHELGALLSALSGAAEGWKCFFLGPDLPAREIVAAALKLEAEVVALSGVDPRLKGTFSDEVLKVRGRLPADVHLVVGGPLTRTDPHIAATEGVEVLESFADLREALRVFAQSA